MTIYSMVNSTITATYMTSGQYAGKVRITVNIGIGDPISWQAVVSSKQDHGLGKTGVYGYPYYVEDFYGSNTYTTYRTYSAGNYVVELALKGTGPIDYSYFDVPGGTPPPPTQYHNICQNNVCTQVSGAGTDECTPLGSACGVVTCSRTVKVQEGSGSVKVYKNNNLIATVTSSQTFTGLTDNDTLRLEAVPASGYIFQKWCDESNSCVTGNPWQLGVYCTFTSREYRAYFLQQITTVSLEVRREQGSGKVNVYQNNGYIGLLNDTETSKTFSFNSGSQFKLEAYPITGYIFEKWCDQNGCITNPDLTGTISSNQTGTNAKKVYFKQVTPPPPTQYHNICQNNVCTQVSGAGANECSTPGVNCTHKVCWNNVCTALDGPGTDECTTIGAACGTPTATKYNCVSGVCKGPFTTGTYNSYADCVADGCGSGGDGEIDPCDKCTSDQYCLFGSCYKKNDIYMAVGAVVLLMVLTKK